jgi:hypothetical protein
MIVLFILDGGAHLLGLVLPNGRIELCFLRIMECRRCEFFVLISQLAFYWYGLAHISELGDHAFELLHGFSEDLLGAAKWKVNCDFACSASRDNYMPSPFKVLSH